MTDIVKLRTGYAVKVSVLRVGFAGPPGADGSVYDDTPILARIAAVEQSIATLPTPYDYAALAGRVAALEGASASVAWTDIVGKPSAFPPTTHQHSFADITGLTNALAAKADAATVLTLEAILDAVAAMFQSGTHTNAAISYDDAAGTSAISVHATEAPSSAATRPARAASSYGAGSAAIDCSTPETRARMAVSSYALPPPAPGGPANPTRRTDTVTA